MHTWNPGNFCWPMCPPVNLTIKKQKQSPGLCNQQAPGRGTLLLRLNSCGLGHVWRRVPVPFPSSPRSGANRHLPAHRRALPGLWWCRTVRLGLKPGKRDAPRPTEVWLHFPFPPAGGERAPTVLPLTGLGLAGPEKRPVAWAPAQNYLCPLRLGWCTHF